MKTLIKWLLLLLLFALLLAGLASGGWILTETVVQASSGKAFCGRCHTMQPFVASYEQAAHGGGNPQGVVAQCVDCHLPHDSPTSYLVGKVKTGAHDGWSQMLSIFKEPDWIGNLERRAEFVYDSGCLNCHVQLEQATGDNVAARVSHQGYFNGDGSAACVDCHQHVGHKDLLAHLNDKTGDVSEVKE